MAINKLAIIGGSGLYDVEEFKDRGQLHTRRDGSTTLGKKETPAERIEREERDALFYEAIKRDRMEEEKELNKRDRY